jgi:predicted NAD-dependent protein-ADP-ribosyltransferase YbiA (DUF1768 family)
VFGVINIYSKSENWMARSLSNFAEHEFILDGIQISCFEAFLQSLKFSDPEGQQEILSMSGKDAKKAGSNQQWEKAGWLYWNGHAYHRNSREYRLLLEGAYDALLEKPNFRAALAASKGKLLIHTVGRMRHTVLTSMEFCWILMKKRRQLLRDMNVRTNER